MGRQRTAVCGTAGPPELHFVDFIGNVDDFASLFGGKTMVSRGNYCYDSRVALHANLIEIMIIKKTLLAIALNVLFGGVGYLYLKEPTRKPLGIFLIFVTVYEFVRNIFIMSNPATGNDPFAVHTLPMLSLFGSISGTIILAVMAVDVYFLAKRQSNKVRRLRNKD